MKKKLIHYLIMDDSSLLLVCTICHRYGDAEETDPYPKTYGCRNCGNVIELSVKPSRHYEIDFDVSPPTVVVRNLPLDMDWIDVYIDDLMPIQP